MDLKQQLSHSGWLHSLTPELARKLRSLPPNSRLLEEIAHNWLAWRRPEQTPPEGNWHIWLILAGRGWGKTRTAAEFIRSRVDTGKAHRVALVARTSADARDTMIEGESGMLSLYPRRLAPKWEPSRRRLTWPSGAIGTVYTADEPDLLRGPAHDLAWCDELATWRYLEAWDNLMLSLRSGQHPQCVVATTPRPINLIKQLLTDKSCVVTRGRTYDNLENLAPMFKNHVLSKYEGTRLGRQELEGEVIDDVVGALWSRDLLEQTRAACAPTLRRVVVAIDPSGSGRPESDECGIVVAGVGDDGHLYVIDDESGQMSPDAWGRCAAVLWKKYKADRIVAESNFGGDMVALTIHTSTPNAPVKLLHAAHNKQARAEPVVALYEQGRAHHVGQLAALEDELCGWVPGSGRSPNRLDALVWAVTELALGVPPPPAPTIVVDDYGSRVNPYEIR